MRSRYYAASGNIVSAGKAVRIHTVHLSHTATATATFKKGGSGGTTVGVVRVAQNDGKTCDFKGGVIADYITLSAGVATVCFV